MDLSGDSSLDRCFLDGGGPAQQKLAMIRVCIRMISYSC